MNIFKFNLLILILLASFNCKAYSLCQKCQDLREYHAMHPEDNYEFYEDYLKDLEKIKDNTPTAAKYLDTPSH
jgi:hypothetical protein